MEIVCKNCDARYYLSDDKIPLETRTGKCKKCGTTITVLGKNTFNSDSIIQQKISAEPETTKNCEFCGEKILAIAKKCRYCGGMLDGSYVTNSQTEEKLSEDVALSQTNDVINNNNATSLWSKKIKTIVIVFLLTISLVLIWYVKFHEVVTTTIEERNGIVYIPNSNEPFTGKYQEFYSNGQKQKEGNFKDGKANGLFTEWYKNGQKKTEQNYKDGELDGLMTGWFENGQKEGEMNYKNGKLNGLSKKWYKNGQEESEMDLKDGELDGLMTDWYENGQKRSEVNKKNGKLNGLSTKWYENGQKESEMNFKDGKLNGLSTRWNENGQKEGEMNFKDGKLNGLSTKWYENGQKEIKKNFKDGFPIE